MAQGHKARSRREAWGRRRTAAAPLAGALVRPLGHPRVINLHSQIRSALPAPHASLLARRARPLVSSHFPRPPRPGPLPAAPRSPCCVINHDSRHFARALRDPGRGRSGGARAEAGGSKWRRLDKWVSFPGRPRPPPRSSQPCAARAPNYAHRAPVPAHRQRSAARAAAASAAPPRLSATDAHNRRRAPPRLTD